MRMNRFHFCLFLGLTLLLGILSNLAAPTPASGHERDTGFQLTISQSAAETDYGALQEYRAILTFPPTRAASIDVQQLNFLINNQIWNATYQGQSNQQATFLLLVDTINNNPMPIGQYSVSATYFDATTQTTTQSNTLIHTIGKGNLGAMQCEYYGATTAVTGQPVTFLVQFSNKDIDPHVGTYSVSFIGPASVTYPNLTLDSADYLTMQAPTVKGTYTFQCKFNGTSLYNSDQQPDTSFAVSEGRQPGAIRLYSNPTTLVPGHLATVYVVVPTTPGLPAPTGLISFSFSGFPTNGITLGQGGDVTVSITLPGNDPNLPLYVTYSGDNTYTNETTSFSLTNPPIPGQAPPATPVTVKSGNGTAVATATPVATATDIASVATATPSPAITPTSALAVTDATNGTGPTSNHRGNAGGGNFWLVTILLLLGIGGGTGGIWFMRKRVNSQMMPVAASQTPVVNDITEFVQSPLDGDITEL